MIQSTRFLSRTKSLFLSLYAFLGIYAILYSPTFVLTGTGITKILVLCALVVAGLYASVRLKDVCGNELWRNSMASLRDARSSTASGGWPRLWQSIPSLFEPVATIAGGYLKLIPKFSWGTLLFLVYGMFVFVLMQLFASLRGGDSAAIQLLVALYTGIVPVAYFIVRAFPPDESAFNHLVRLIGVAGAIQSIFIILDWFSPLARAIFSSIVIQPAALAESFRAAGLTSMTGDGLSFSQALCGIAAFYLSVHASEWRKRILWMCCFCLALVSMMFVGRTGFVIVFVFILFYSIFSRNRARAIGDLLASAVLIASLIVVSILIFDSEKLTFMVDTVLPYAFESFYRLFAGEGFRTTSSDDLMMNNIILPSNNWTWMIGDGYFADPTTAEANYQGTDIGYLRVLFYVGLIGSMALYSWFALAAYIIFRALPNAEKKLFSAAAFVCLFAAHLKFPFFFQTSVLGFVCLMLFSSRQDRKQCV